MTTGNQEMRHCDECHRMAYCLFVKEKRLWLCAICNVPADEAKERLRAEHEVRNWTDYWGLVDASLREPSA